MTWPFSLVWQVLEPRYNPGPKMPKHVLGQALYSVLTVLVVYKGTTELKMGRAPVLESVGLKKKSKLTIMGHGGRMLPWTDSKEQS